MEAAEWLVVVLKVRDLSPVTRVDVLVAQVAAVVREIAEIVVGHAGLGQNVESNLVLHSTNIHLSTFFLSLFVRGTHPIRAVKLVAVLLPLRKLAVEKLYLVEGKAGVVPLRRLVISEQDLQQEGEAENNRVVLPCSLFNGASDCRAV